jgi:hypothetical protein
VSPQVCRLCLKRVLLARTEAHGRAFLLDPEPDPAGNQAVFRPPAGPLQTRQLNKDEEPRPYETRYMPHIATCTGRKEQAPAPPQNVTPISAARSLRDGRNNPRK